MSSNTFLQNQKFFKMFWSNMMARMKQASQKRKEWVCSKCNRYFEKWENVVCHVKRNKRCQSAGACAKRAKTPPKKLVEDNKKRIDDKIEVKKRWQIWTYFILFVRFWEVCYLSGFLFFNSSKIITELFLWKTFFPTSKFSIF